MGMEHLLRLRVGQWCICYMSELFGLTFEAPSNLSSVRSDREEYLRKPVSTSPCARTFSVGENALVGYITVGGLANVGC
jgi:hypothetical protein